MRHTRPSWWRRQTDAHPWLPNALAVAGIVVSIVVILLLLLWVSAARVKGLG